ncbi:MAG: hypothetical protein WCF85_22505 [Rhodospirillaceae bacterium]
MMESSAVPATTIPKGMIGILIDDHGHVLVHHTDFDPSGCLGFTLQDAQRMRVTRGVADKMIASFCNPIVGRLIKDWVADEMLREAVAHHGYRLDFIAIGHDGCHDGVHVTAASLLEGLD